jgi:hypothetical protein
MGIEVLRSQLQAKKPQFVGTKGKNQKIDKKQAGE